MKKIYNLLLTCVILVSCNTKTETVLTVNSPDGSIKTNVCISDTGITYEMRKDSIGIIKPSSMGFLLKNMPELSKNMKVIDVIRDTVDVNWEQPWGEQKVVRNNYNEVLVKLKETQKPGRLMNIRFRMFNDGLGFRYEFPEQEAMDSIIIMQENTEFNFVDDYTSWSIPSPAFYTRYYESLYREKKLSEVSDTITTPFTMKGNNGLYISVHEAGLIDYAKMNLYSDNNTDFNVELTPWSTGEKVFAKLPFYTPWRTIVVGNNAGELIESRLMLNLNEPSKLDDVSWFEPGVYVGVWWGMHMRDYTWAQGPKHGAKTSNVKKYIDFAAKNNIKGVLVEGWNEGWNGNWAKNGDKFKFNKPFDDFDIEYLSNYAKSKNVRIIGHNETAGAVSNYESQLDSAFSFCEKYNINVVKTGYVAKYMDGKELHDSQFGVRHQMKVVETAAKYHVAINNHEPVMPTGICRTWPNLVSQEGMRGQEYDAWSPDGGNPPVHTTILPFTRGLAGPMDFTPGTFNFKNKFKPNTRVQTTLAKQLALYVVLYSPIQMASDMIENYEGKKAFDFIKTVPCNWEETIIPDAEIGEYIVTVRKDINSDNWFMGAITNEKSRNIQLNLNFLTDGLQYIAYIYEDGKNADWKNNPEDINIRKEIVDCKSVMDISLAEGGGCAIKFEVIQ